MKNTIQNEEMMDYEGNPEADGAIIKLDIAGFEAAVKDNQASRLFDVLSEDWGIDSSAPGPVIPVECSKSDLDDETIKARYLRNVYLRNSHRDCNYGFRTLFEENWVQFGR